MKRSSYRTATPLLSAASAAFGLGLGLVAVLAPACTSVAENPPVVVTTPDGGNTARDSGADSSRPTADASSSDAATGNDSGPGPGVVTVSDPAPTVSTPGKTTCPGCPDTTQTTFEVTTATTSYGYSGTVTGAQGNGTFYVEKLDTDGGTSPFMAGEIPTDASGNFNVTVPLFCGTQIIKAVWTNAAGKLVVVTKVLTNQCVEPDIRVTIAWDATGRDWELHLIKPGGQINDQTNRTDCTWTTCIGSYPDWGVIDDATDDPRKDVDNTGAYGPENITLVKPETGLFTVMVEHWNGGGGATSNGYVFINVKDKPTLAVRIASLAPYHVFTAATIDWPSKTVSTFQTDYDCSATWSSGCTAKLP